MADRRSHPTWQHRHSAVLLWYAANPGGKQHECAAATGYSRSQVSRIVNSEGFRRRYAAVRDQVLRELYAERVCGVRGLPSSW